jgi:uncharacterized ion transporter superfamily protein YfcC
MEAAAGARISQRAFIQSIALLFALMIVAGVLTRVVPAGAYTRVVTDGLQTLDPTSYTPTAHPDYPVWRWFVAPLEVLGGPDGPVIGTIIVFLMMVGGAFAVLDKTGILHVAINALVQRFGGRKYVLLLAITFFFMLIGAFFGIFEEVVPLVPVMIVLSYSLGWDSLVGLGMSILATNMGFSAAVTNPFTIGVAQKIAGLPLFSGTPFRILIFLVVYAITAAFLVGYARRLDRDPSASPIYTEDAPGRARYRNMRFDADIPALRMRPVLIWLGAFLALILGVLAASPFVPALSSYSLPIVGVLFFTGGVGAGLVGGCPGRTVGRAMRDGLAGIAPAIPLILMASSIKYIVSQGGILDTILHAAAGAIAQASPLASALLVYALALVIEVFVASGSAKAFLLIPILVPLADLVGVTRQVTVTAYCFGDGFSNLAYPTNPVLLVCLGLTVVGYSRWLRWTGKLWLWVILATVAFLGLAVAIHYGPF